jgi:hypothetical protein
MILFVFFLGLSISDVIFGLHIHIILSGSLRTFPLLYNRIKTHVVDQLEFDGFAQVTTSLCVDYLPLSATLQQILDKLNVINVWESNSDQYYSKINGKRSRDRNDCCFRLALYFEMINEKRIDREKEKDDIKSMLKLNITDKEISTHYLKRNYDIIDYFIFHRTDLFWFDNIDKGYFQYGSVSLRARHIWFDNSHNIKETSVSYIPSQCCSRGRGCSLRPDDQFAIIPRQYAPSYFIEDQNVYDNIKRVIMGGNGNGNNSKNPYYKTYQHPLYKSLQNPAISCGITPFFGRGSEDELAKYLRMRKTPVVVGEFGFYMTMFETLVPRWEPRGFGIPDGRKKCLH